MAIKAGSILTDVNGFVVDRIQSGGPGNLNIPQEKIFELGNWKSVAIVRDIPDLSFDLESFDVTTEFEALLVGKKGTAKYGEAAVGRQLDGRVNYNEVDFQNHVPIDVISPFKSRRNRYNIVKGVAVPYLTLERATYRYGIGQNATQQFTLRTDSVYYTPGQPYYQDVTYNSGTTTYSFTTTPAIEYTEGANSIYALCITAVSDTNDFRRLFAPGDYTSTSTGFTLTSTGVDKVEALESDSNIYLHVVYSSSTTGDYTQTGNNPSGNRVHENTVSVKPAAVRPRDIDVYIGTADATPTFTRLTSVQSAEVNWSVQLDNDQEFGNRHYVLSDYFVPDVSGTIGVKPYNTDDMWEKLSRITTGSSSSYSKVIGPMSAVPVPLEIRINHPDSGDRIKTIYVPDARFQIPGLQGRVQTKVESSLAFTSDSGDMYVYNGKRTN